MMLLLSVENVIQIHDSLILPNELQGLAKDKDLAGCLARVHNRIAYGLIADVFDLAACYTMAIARGHCFNDANKRTAAVAMDFVLNQHGITLAMPANEIGDQIIALAAQKIDEHQFADCLRQKLSIQKGKE